ncbi:hypothetical protein [Halovivax gelatinilyticus]|uniref:hypothetical protein n=1 Tax=Halovivax gelatinilyticus TaxID=2961597 RepID=UPI0020CA84F5|nr:hypothetical protein [Halovivax gelatinilyticus]
MAGRPDAANSSEPEDDMLPDERQVITERGGDSEESEDEPFLTVEELAAKIGFERDT